VNFEKAKGLTLERVMVKMMMIMVVVMMMMIKY
jgi:hypothetical protein